MHIVAVAWIFVVVLMTLAEATSPDGTLLGAFFTLLLYGLLPLAIVLYVMGTPARRRARQAREREELQAASAETSDRGSQAPGDPVAPERKES